MKKALLLSAIFVLALATLACGISIDLPVETLNAGPTETEQIFVPVPEQGSADVRLEFGAGVLELSPGAESGLIEGIARYNVTDLAPDVDITGEQVRISTGDFEIKGIPTLRFDDLENTWELNLGTAPMDLDIKAGAYEGDYDLGGLSLGSLEISDGAADVRLDFSEPNLVVMERFRYSTGASSVKMTNLGNANFKSMSFSGGAGDYLLDFSDGLQQDASVTIKAGISELTIIVPEDQQVEVNLKTRLSNVDADGNWQRSGSTYQVSGSGPKLTIFVEMGAGNLVLRGR
jgi:hypothetical protein